MYCKKCGTALEGNDKFCNKCGTEIGQSKTAKQQIEYRPESNSLEYPFSDELTRSQNLQNETTSAFRVMGIIVGAFMIIGGAIFIYSGNEVRFGEGLGRNFNTMLYHAIHWGFGIMLISQGLLAIAYFGRKN